jgi:DNA-directed RNA polymerase subunit K/omega
VIAPLLTVESAGAAHAASAARAVAVRAQQRVSIAASLVDPEQLLDTRHTTLAVDTQTPIAALIELLVVGANQLSIGASEPLVDKLLAPLEIALGERLSWQLSLNTLSSEIECRCTKRCMVDVETRTSN